MTTPTERTQALINAGNLLEELAVGESQLDIVGARERARNLLRHFPSNMEIAWLAEVAARSPFAIAGSPLDPAAVPQGIRKGYRQW